MKVDRVFRNAKIFTADSDNPWASALAIKDGRFCYVGDDRGLADFEGEVSDLGGSFIMPGIIDSHVHVAFGAAFEFTDMGERIECSGKQAILDYVAAYMRDKAGLSRYRFVLDRKYLGDEVMVKEDLDAICPDGEVLILEAEGHSIWVNSKILALHGITDETVDPVPGLSYYQRRDGHVTGNVREASCMPIIFDHLTGLTDDELVPAVTRWVDFCREAGVSAVFDAGFPENNGHLERIYDCLRDMDLRGELPVHIEGCYMVTQPRKLKEGIGELRRFNRKFDTDHLKVHTLKLIMDGTLKNETAAMVTPYADTGATGTCAFTADEIAQMLRDLNEAGMDVHVHTIGERSSRVVLDGVEQARRELGDAFRVRVTCAHLELQDDADLGRFAELGVICNYTPWWHGGMGETDQAHYFGEERAKKMYRCKTVWDTGALVTWSSDNIAYGDFTNWSPYLGMEVGMTRWVSEQTVAPEYTRSDEEFPSASEKMGVEEMMLGYTINGAIELGIDDAKGSITVGKDADFLVFDCDLTRAEHVGFSQNVPDAVYFAGRLVGGEGSLAGLEEARRSAELPWRSHWGACGSAGRDPRHGA